MTFRIVTDTDNSTAKGLNLRPTPRKLGQQAEIAELAGSSPGPSQASEERVPLTPAVHAQPVIRLVSIAEMLGTVKPSPVIITCEAEVLAILKAPPPMSMSAQQGFSHKEHAIGALFASSSVPESRELFKRLNRNQRDPAAEADPLYCAFQTLVHDRRNRLLAFLADAARRAASTPRRS